MGAYWTLTTRRSEMVAFFEERLSRVRETSAPPATAPPRRATSAEPDGGRWRSTVAVAWFVLMPLAIVLEPVPAPHAVEPWYVTVASVALLASIGTMLAGLAQNR
jgi:hypothetical protein